MIADNDFISMTGTYLFNHFDKSFTIMFSINASLLFLSIVYSLLNLEVKLSFINGGASFKVFFFLSFSVADNAEATSADGTAMHQVDSRLL